MKVREKQINNIYGLTNANNNDFEAKRYEPGSWIARLCPGKEVSWADTKRSTSMNDFTAEAWVWLAIFCSLVSPNTHMKADLDLRGRMVAYILDNISLNVGLLIILDISSTRTMVVCISYSISNNEIFRRHRVVEYPRDTWVFPGIPIYPLKIQGESASGKRKKRKNGLVKSTLIQSLAGHPQPTPLMIFIIT